MGIILNLASIFPKYLSLDPQLQKLFPSPCHPPLGSQGSAPPQHAYKPQGTSLLCCGLPLISHIAPGCSLRPPHSWSSATCESIVNIPLRLPQACCLLEEDGNQICSRTRWHGYVWRGGPAPRRELAQSPPEAHTRAQVAEAPGGVGPHLQTQDHPPQPCVPAQSVTPPRAAQSAPGQSMPREHIGSSHPSPTFAFWAESQQFRAGRMELERTSCLKPSLYRKGSETLVNLDCFQCPLN